MQAMTFMLPPQTLQDSMSTLNTRFKRYAQLIADLGLAQARVPAPGRAQKSARRR